jgi:hypothetical protein
MSKSKSERASERRKIIQAVNKRFATKFSPPPTPMEALVEKAAQITLAMRAHIQPILESGGGHDTNALRELIMTLYVEAFHKAFDRDALVNLLAIIHTEIALENVAANPSGSPKGPDALSGT